MKAVLSYRGGSIKQEKADALVGKLSGMRNSLLRDAHQQTNGQGSCGTYTPWNITQPLK